MWGSSPTSTSLLGHRPTVPPPPSICLASSTEAASALYFFFKQQQLMLLQKPGSVHYGYYVCSIISNTTTYGRHPCRWQDEKGVRMNAHSDDALLDLVGDLCAFIMDHIVHIKGTFHHPESDLGRNPQYQHLREWERLALGL